jgi:hypothetical protein
MVYFNNIFGCSQLNAVSVAVAIGNVFRNFRAAFMIGNMVNFNNIFGRSE